MSARHEVRELTGYPTMSVGKTAATPNTDVFVVDADYCYRVVFARNAPEHGPQRLERRRFECVWECGRLNNEAA